MSDIRMKEVPFEFEGRTYTLRCNMNVLADVQEAYNGDITPALSTRGTLRSSLEFLAAMLNEDADLRGLFASGELTKRFTARELGRKLKREQIPMAEIFTIVTTELTPENVETVDEGN